MSGVGDGERRRRRKLARAPAGTLARTLLFLSPPPLSSLRATHLATMAFAVAKSAALTTKVATTKRASAVKPVAAFSAER